MRTLRSLVVAVLCGWLLVASAPGCAKGSSRPADETDPGEGGGEEPDGGTPDGAPADGAPADGEPRGSGRASHTFPSGGGGTSSAPGYRLQLSVGAPQPMGSSSSGEQELKAGPQAR